MLRWSGCDKQNNLWYEPLKCDLAGFFVFDDVVEALCYYLRRQRSERDIMMMKANVIQVVKQDYKARFEILSYMSDGEERPRGIRATSGWSFPFIDLELAAHRLRLEHLKIIECFVHRTECPRALHGIMQNGLPPGGPNCWTFEEGIAKRTDVPDQDEYREYRASRGNRWRRDRGVGRGAASADSHGVGWGAAPADPFPKRMRLVAMMSPTPRQGERRAAGDRFNTRFAIYFDVRSLLQSDVELYVAYNGSVMCTAPISSEFITAVQDTQAGQLLYSNALAQFNPVDCEDTPDGERCQSYSAGTRDDPVEADLAAGEILCIHNRCDTIICPGHVYCPGCGRRVVYRLDKSQRDQKDDMDCSAPTSDEEEEEDKVAVGRVADTAEGTLRK